MSDVSTDVLRMAREAWQETVWSSEPDWRGAGLDPARLFEADAVSFDEYVRFLVCSAGSSDPERLRQLGQVLMRHSAEKTPMRHVGWMFGSAAAIYEFIYGWVMVSQIQPLHCDVEIVGRRQVRVRMQLTRPGSARSYFHSVLGTMETLPLYLGQEMAQVDARIDDTVASFVVSLSPRRRSVRGLLGRAWRRARGQGLGAAILKTRATFVDTAGALRQANRALLASQGRLQAITENLPGFVLLCDVQLQVIEVYGGSDRRVRDAGFNLIDHIHPADQIRVRNLLMEMIRTGASVEYELRTVEPLRHWTCRAAVFEESRQLRVIAHGFDVTERVQTSEALRASEERLIRAQKLEAIGRLAGGLAHDINNVLATVQGHAELLALKRPDDPEVDQAVAGIIRATERATGLTGRLLAYGQDRGGEQPEVIDLRAAVTETEGLLDRVLGTDVRLVSELPEYPVAVSMGPSQLQQVILNLVVNARDAMPTGGEIQLSVEMVGGRARLSVADPGVGMDRATTDRIFEPFYTTKAAGKGTGLGLYTVYWIARQTGGSVDVHSAPGQGTTVVVELPLCDELPATVTDSGPEPVTRPGSARLLLVEDETDLRDTLERLLRAAGYQVTAFGDPMQAISWARSGVFDLLVTDIRMPGLTGIELAVTLVEELPELPVVLVSGFTRELPASLPADQVRFLRKPFSSGRLRGMIEDLLDASSDVRQADGAEDSTRQ